ncbi:MAG: phosphoenolpyruvate--protein phosphotransferase [Deltaproteobacteria bacterium]|nr:phosphoenolpyruvate--protein phosphotransferase [Deltaproteobacteria bacterium]
MSSSSFRGLGVSPGLAVGVVHIVDRRRVSIPRHHVTRERVGAERARLLAAVEASEKQLEAARARAASLEPPPPKESRRPNDSLGPMASEIDLLFKAHILMLRDPMLLDAALSRITDERKNAEWAIRDALREIRGIFDGIELDYFRERRSDVDAVGDRILRNLVGEDLDIIANLPENAVIVGYDLSPADAIALVRTKAKAFVLEEGGRTSHLAILARAARAPAVLGVRGIMEVAGSGDEIAVDGHAGVVVLDPEDEDLVDLRDRRERLAQKEARLLGDRDLLAETTDGERIELLGNIEVTDELAALVESGAEGIGLYRTEFMVIERGRLPTRAEHATEYTKLVKALNGRAVTVRTLDLGADKYPRGGRPKGKNPALGLRAIRASLRDPEPFKEQLRGILDASATGRVRLLLPLVSTVAEVRAVKKLFEETKAELKAEGTEFDPDLPLGVMIETPSAVFIADLLAAEVDFFSIGTNDLVQYTLAADRQDPDVESFVSAAEPSVIRMIRAIVDAAREGGCPVSVCGEIAADPLFVPLLVGLGVRSLSMVPQAIPLAKQVIRKISADETRALADLAIECTTASEVEAHLEEYLRRRGIEAKSEGSGVSNPR